MPMHIIIIIINMKPTGKIFSVNQTNDTGNDVKDWRERYEYFQLHYCLPYSAIG